MAKRQPKMGKELKMGKIMNDAEYKNMEYVFICLIIASILFLAIYLIGFINILLKFG